MCSRELAFWQSHMPSVLFTKKLSVVDSLHKQTAWLPWRGFCTPRFQYLVQTMAAEGSSSRVTFPPPASSHAQLEWGENHSHFHLRPHLRWTQVLDSPRLAPHLARTGARLCLYIVIWSSEQSGRLSFCG